TKRCGFFIKQIGADISAKSTLYFHISRTDIGSCLRLLFLAQVLLGVNPFNQPGVEAYKKNMFALLDKPGYEEESKAIKARL
ncbi:MAG: hypothetical protein IIV60_06565, partial [Alistipes sp.]|nr:hypothetical protein [Alistipes sp.]